MGCSALFFPQCALYLGFSGGSVVKNLPADAGDAALIPGLGRSPAEGNGNPLQYSLVNPGYRDFSPWGHKELDRNK